MASTTLAHSNWRYNIDGGNWQQGSGRTLSVGRSNEPKIYRGWITFSLSNFSAAYIMQASSLYFKRYDSYGTISWDIGLRDSEPPKTFTESDFQYSIANNYSTTSNAEYNVSITAAQMSAFVGKTVYVCFCGYSTSSYCYGEVDMSTSGKTPKLTANYLYAKSTIASASNGTIGSQQTITVSRQDASYTHTLTATCAGRTETIATKSSNLTLTWTPSVANFAPLITNSMSATCTYTLTTYYGATSVGTDSRTVTLSLPSASVAPTLTFSVSDPNGYAAHFNNKYIVGKSKYTITAQPVYQYGATQASVTITANGATYSSSPATTGVIGSGQSSIVVKVTDSRSQTAQASVVMTLLSYANPNLSVTVQRCDSGGTADSSGAYCKVTSTYSITALDNINTRSLTIKYKKTSASTYTSVSRTISAYTGTDTYIFAADTDSQYNVQVLLQDYFSTTTVNKTLPTIAVVFDLHSSGSGMGFGKVAEYSNLLDIAWPIAVRNQNLTVYDSTNTVVVGLGNDGRIVNGVREIDAAPAESGQQSFNFTINTSFVIDGVSFPKYAKGQFVCSGNDSVMYCIGADGILRVAFRNGATWHSLGAMMNPKHRHLTGSVAAVYNSYVDIISTSLPAGYFYMIMATADTNLGTSSTGIMGCSITGASSTRATRTSIQSGGGCEAFAYLTPQASATTVKLQGYGYVNATYNYRGNMEVFQFPNMQTF